MCNRYPQSTPSTISLRWKLANSIQKMDSRDSHGIFNVISLGILNVLTGVHLFQNTEGEHLVNYVSLVLLYFVTDTLWIFVKPCCVRTPSSIVFHHLVSIAGIVCVPMTTPNLRPFLVQLMTISISTWLLAVRQLSKRRVFMLDITFLSSWIAIRLIYYPFCLLQFAVRIGESSGTQVIVFILVCLTILNVIWSLDIAKNYIRGDFQHEIDF